MEDLIFETRGWVRRNGSIDDVWPIVAEKREAQLRALVPIVVHSLQVMITELL